MLSTCVKQLSRRVASRAAIHRCHEAMMPSTQVFMMNTCMRGPLLCSPMSTMATAPVEAWESSFLTHAEVAKRFEEFDLDGDGFITVASARAAIDRLEGEFNGGIARESVLPWDNDFDDSIVDYFEFMDHFMNSESPESQSDGASNKKFDSIADLLKYCIVKGDQAKKGNRERRQAKVELIKTFKLIDVDQDGFIDREEMRIALRDMSPDAAMLEIDVKLNNIFAAADVNQDGVIDLYEFSARAVHDGLYS